MWRTQHGKLVQVLSGEVMASRGAAQCSSDLSLSFILCVCRLILQARCHFIPKSYDASSFQHTTHTPSYQYPTAMSSILLAEIYFMLQSSDALSFWCCTYFGGLQSFGLVLYCAVCILSAQHSVISTSLCSFVPFLCSHSFGELSTFFLQSTLSFVLLLGCTVHLF